MQLRSSRTLLPFGFGLASLLLLACGSSPSEPWPTEGAGGSPQQSGGSGSAAGPSASGGNPGPSSSGGAAAGATGGMASGASGGAGVGGAGSGGDSSASGGSAAGASTGVAGSAGSAGSPGTGIARTEAMNLVADMGIGWNLGNTFDATDANKTPDETAWGQPRTTQQMIDALKNWGFKTLRVPVSWDDHVSGSGFEIDAAWLSRVEEVLNYGLKNGMYVIVNVHHQNGWLSPTLANEANAKNRLTRLWQQIGPKFQKYDQHLIFETMNEPRFEEDWNGKDEYFQVINRLNDAAVKAIRATGGNNEKRLVMVPGYVAGVTQNQLNGIVLPKDGMLALSTHAYIPYAFALQMEGTSSFTATSDVDGAFSRLKTMFIDKGIPVVMGEWASMNKNNLPERVRHAEYYVKAAKKAGVPTVWWDNQNFTANSIDATGLFDRKALTFHFPEIMTALKNGMQ